MGKISVKDTEALKKEGVLSNKAMAELGKRNLVAKKTSTKRFIKTADGKFVEPKLYFRGSNGTKPSKEMIEFQTAYTKLLNKYTTTKTTNK